MSHNTCVSQFECLNRFECSVSSILIPVERLARHQADLPVKLDLGGIAMA